MGLTYNYKFFRENVLKNSQTIDILALYIVYPVKKPSCKNIQYIGETDNRLNERRTCRIATLLNWMANILTLSIIIILETCKVNS